MPDQKILDIFYQQIVKEAEKGQINCYFICNITFILTINNKKINNCDKLEGNSLSIPILKVNNIDLFNALLIEYVKKANVFYSNDDFRFLDDLDASNIEDKERLKEEYRIKYIICNLLANASLNDFEQPIEFLENRIAMFENNFLKPNTQKYIGYLSSIGAKLYAYEEKSPIQAESPYRIRSYLKFDNDYILELPEIYAGTNGLTSYLYGIQKTTPNNEIEESPYLKQIRKGFIAKLNGAKEHYFIAVMLYLSLSSEKQIEVIPFLITRWNAKRIALIKKKKRNKDITMEQINTEHDKIQTILTDILIRYFTKINDVSIGLTLLSLPFDFDSNMHLEIEENFTSRCQVFNEIYNLVKEYQNQKKLT